MAIKRDGTAKRAVLPRWQTRARDLAEELREALETLDDPETSDCDRMDERVRVALGLASGDEIPGVDMDTLLQYYRFLCENLTSSGWWNSGWSRLEARGRDARITCLLRRTGVWAIGPDRFTSAGSSRCNRNR